MVAVPAVYLLLGSGDRAEGSGGGGGWGGGKSMTDGYREGHEGRGKGRRDQLQHRVRLCA